jgi:hypothetical protein
VSDVISVKDRMFQRLANIVKERFDIVITFTDFSARYRVADMKTINVVQRNSFSNIIIMAQDVVMPIRANSHLFGYVTVFRGMSLDQTSLDQIRDATDLLLTETCQLEEKSHRLKILEHYLKDEMTFQDVIELKARLERDEIHFLNPEISVNHDSLDSVFPILVESHTEAEAKEFALEIHRTSERSSFLTYEEYLANELSEVENLKELGPITLFIPNIRHVSLDIQISLASFLRSPTRSTLHPRIIVAIQESPERLTSLGIFDNVLFEKLSSARLKLPPKGTSAMSIDEILGFFEQTQKKERHLYLVTPNEPPH